MPTLLMSSSFTKEGWVAAVVAFMWTRPQRGGCDGAYMNARRSSATRAENNGLAPGDGACCDRGCMEQLFTGYELQDRVGQAMSKIWGFLGGIKCFAVSVFRTPRWASEIGGVGGFLPFA